MMGRAVSLWRWCVMRPPSGPGRGLARVLLMVAVMVLLWGAALSVKAAGQNPYAPVVQMFAGYSHTCVHLRVPMRDMRCWGKSAEGQLGAGDTNHRGDNAFEMGRNLTTIDFGPDRVSLNRSVFALPRHNCLVLQVTTGGDDELKCFGWNLYGQLGYGDTTNRGDMLGQMGTNLSVVDLGTDTAAIRQVANCLEHTCVVFVDDRIKCWGRALTGQLGYEDANDRGDGPSEMGDALPYVNLGVDLGAASLIVGGAHSCAILNDSETAPKLKCWGYNSNGQLGQGDTTNRGNLVGQMGSSLPFVNLGSHVYAVGGQGEAQFTCVLLNDSSVKCFGANDYGQLGYGDTTDRGDNPGEMGDALPAVDILGSATAVSVVAITTGNVHACAHISDGSLKCWGRGLFGRLGYGDTANRGDGGGEMGDSLPSVSLGPMLSLAAVGVSTVHTCVLLNDSSVKCFGANTEGRLGYGDTTNRGSAAGQMGANLPRVDRTDQRTDPATHSTSQRRTDAGSNDTPYSSTVSTTYGCTVFGAFRKPHPGTNSEPISRSICATHFGAFLGAIRRPDPGTNSWPDSGAVRAANADAVRTAFLCAYLGAVADPEQRTDDPAHCRPFPVHIAWPDKCADAVSDCCANDSAHRAANADAVRTAFLCAYLGAPSQIPSNAPTIPPTAAPSPSTSPGPTSAPTPSPTAVPTTPPTVQPSTVSSAQPTTTPSSIPSSLPSIAPTGPASASPTASPTMAPTQPIATILADNEVSQVSAVVQGGGTVYVRWPAQSDPRMTVVGYRVAMQTSGTGSFATVAAPSQNWTAITGLSPATRYGFKVAVVANRGVGSLSDGTAEVTTKNDSVGFFEDSGVAVRVVASIPLPACDASAIMDASESVIALFGSSNPPCALVNPRTARLQLRNGAMLAPGTVARVWTNETFTVAPPSNPTPVAPSLSSASRVAWCDAWAADAASSTGVGGNIYPLRYSWWVSSQDVGNAAAVTEENTHLSSLSPTTTRVLFNASHFVQDTVVTVHVTVKSSVFNLSATTQADTNISALEQPTVSIAGSANRTVLSFQDLAIRSSVSTPHCFSSSANRSTFSWVALQGVMPASAATTTRTLTIPALSLDVTQTYLFRVRMLLEELPDLPAVTADVHVSTLLAPPVVALAGGTQRTVGCQADTTLDASPSYDPNVCGTLQACPALTFTWSCTGCTETSFDDVQNDAARLHFRGCDLVNSTTAFPDADTTAVLQLDVAVHSSVSQLIASSGVETTVLAPEIPVPPVIVLDPVPGMVTPNDTITLCSGSNGTLDIADTETQTSSLQAVGSYFTLSTAALQPGVQYQLSLQDPATGVVAATSVVLNDPPSLGSFAVSPNSVGGGEAVLDAFEFLSQGHIDDPAHMPLSTSFSWRDDTGYEAVLAEHTAEFSLASVALPAGSSVTARVQVSDRLGSSSSVATALTGTLSVSISALPSAVDWSRPGAITGALLSWADFSDALLSELLGGRETLSFAQLTLMAGLSPGDNQAQSILDLAPKAFAAVSSDELSQSTCADAQAIATLRGVNAITSLLLLAQVADSGCGGSVFFVSATASEPYVSLSDISTVRVGLAQDTDVSGNGVRLQIGAAVTSSLASDAEFVDTRTSTVSDSSAFATANTQVLSPVHNLELRPSTLPCSGLCNDWEGQANGTCTAQDLSANTSKLGEDTVIITIDVGAEALDLEPVEDKCGNKVEPEVKCMHVQLIDLLEASDSDDTNVTWSTEGCELVERTKDSVTCVCSHLTAFAVGAIMNPGEGECGETQCEVLGGTWGEIYDSPGYAFWLALLCCAWVFILVTDAQWFYDPDTKQQRSKFTVLVFISQTTIVLAVLRIAYYVLMLLAYSTAENGMACAEFGLQGSGSLVPPHALFAVHDIFYPVFLTMFASVFLYWLDLADLVAVNMGKAKNLLFLRTETWQKLIVFNACLLLYSAGLNTYLVILGNSDSGTSAAARGHLAFMAAVYVAEAGMFIYGRNKLDEQSQDKSMMKKIVAMSKTLCGLFLCLGLLLLLLAASPAVQHAESAFVLYSVLLPVLELATARFVYSSMHAKRRRDANVALVERSGSQGSKFMGSFAAMWARMCGRTPAQTATSATTAGAAATGSQGPSSASPRTGPSSKSRQQQPQPQPQQQQQQQHEKSSMSCKSHRKLGSAGDAGTDAGEFQFDAVYGAGEGKDTAATGGTDGQVELQEFRRASTGKASARSLHVKSSDKNERQVGPPHPRRGRVASPQAGAAQQQRAFHGVQTRLDEPLSPASPASGVQHTHGLLSGLASPRRPRASLEGSTRLVARRQSLEGSETGTGHGIGDGDEDPDTPSVGNPMFGISATERRRRRRSSAEDVADTAVRAGASSSAISS